MSNIINFVKIGKRIQFHRKKSGLKQSELAEMIGISHKYMSHLEMGNHRASLDIYYKIAKALKLPLEALVEDQLEPKSEAYIHLIRENTKEFSDKQLLILKNFIEILKDSDF